MNEKKKGTESGNNSVPLLYNENARDYGERCRLAFNCLEIFSDSLVFAGKYEFSQYLPKFIMLAWTYSECEDGSVMAVARSALISLTSFSGMPASANSIRKSISMMRGFLENIAINFVREMDNRCVDAAYNLFRDKKFHVQRNLALFLCACMNQNKAMEKQPQYQMVSLLATEDSKLKLAILEAIKTFPPSL